MKNKSTYLKSLLFTIGFLISISASAQKNKEEDYERIKAMKTAYLTDRIGLNSEEAAEFWPVYNDFESRMHQERKAMYAMMRPYKNQDAQDQLSESESKELWNKLLEFKQSELKLEEEKDRALSKLIGYKRVLIMHYAERDFNRRLFKNSRDKKSDQSQP
jgi:Skp family chaperone for outer membrane proteins